MAANPPNAVPVSTKALTSGRSGGTATFLVLLTAAMLLAAWALPSGWNYVVVMVLVAAFIVLLGLALTGRALGILINERRLMSLSRFQMALWTVLIIAGYFVVVVARVKSGEVAEPLVILIDWQLWALLGISTTALVGSPLLDANKKRKELGKDQAQKQELLTKTADAFKAEGETVLAVDRNREGILYGNESLDDARFTDLFEGDEVGNAHLIDVGKLQMFLFTAIVAVVFAAQLFQLIAYSDLLADDIGLPVLPGGLLALMGVSNTAYLANKGVARTPTPT